MGDALEWIAAIGGVLATVGTWAGPSRARRQLRTEELRTGQAQRENELHRWRYAELWGWQRRQPEGDERADAARWFAEWTGTVRARRGGLDLGPQVPAQYSGNVDEAYWFYVDFLGGMREASQLAPPPAPPGLPSSGESR